MPSVPVRVDPQTLPQRGQVWRFDDGRVGVVATRATTAAGGRGVTVYVGPESFTVALDDVPLVFGRAVRVDTPAAAERSSTPSSEVVRHLVDPRSVGRSICGATMNRGDSTTIVGPTNCVDCLDIETIGREIETTRTTANVAATQVVVAAEKSRSGSGRRKRQREPKV